MRTEQVQFNTAITKEQIADLYEQTIAAEKRRNQRSFSYRTKYGGFCECGCAPSAYEMRAKLADSSGAVFSCTMESSLGLFGMGETTEIDLRNTDEGCRAKILGPEIYVCNIRSVLSALMGAEGQCTYAHEYKREYDARLEARFSGYVPAGHWPGRVQKMDALTEELTGVRILKEHIPDFRRGWPNMHMRDGGYVGFKTGDGELHAKVNASFYEANRAMGMGNFGVSAEFVYRGTEESVERAFRTSIQRIGFPRDVEVPAAGRLPFRQEKGFFNRFLSNTTNVKGWRAAVRAAAAEGAELGRHTRSNCRFPYNLLIRDRDGKISKDGHILDPDWGEDPIASAMAHGRIGSVITLDSDTLIDRKVLRQEKDDT